MKKRNAVILTTIFVLLALVLFPITAAWVFFAGLAGYTYPRKALMGENFDEAFDPKEKSCKK